MTILRGGLAAVLAFSAAPAMAQSTEPAADQAREDAAEAGDIIVTGRAQALYRVEETVTGGLPTEPLASSQTITVITDELIRDQGARDAQNLYRNISGVSVFSYAGVTARGFRQEENFYDGLRGDPYQGFAVPQLFNVERVEFLKGPAGMLYGQTAPGGLFNYVTRRPRFEASGEVRIIGGTQSRYGISGETTGRLAGPIAYRVAGFYEDRDQQRENAHSTVALFDGGLSADLGFGTLTFQATHYDIDLGGNRLRGVPTDNAGNFLADREWNHNEESDYLRLESSVYQLRFEGRITDNLTVNLTGRNIDATETQQYHEPINLIRPTPTSLPTGVTRQFRDQRRDNDTWSFGGNAIWSQRFSDTVTNRVLFGADHFTNRLVFDSRSSTGTALIRPNLPTPLNFVNPAYGVTNPAAYTYQAVSLDQVTDTERRGAYLLDELTIGRLILVAGIRTDSFEDQTATARFSGDATTYRAGAVFRIRPDISIFAQYATSFEPQSAASQDARAGGPFAPTSGDIIEGGVRTSLFNGKLQSNLSVYQIRRTNILQADPAGPIPDPDGVTNLIALGEVTSKGFDFDLATDITPDWVLTLTYAYNDTRITATTPTGTVTNAVGDRFANAPEHQLGFWTRYQIRPLGLAFALGGDYISERINLSGQTVQSYFVFDASLMWQRGPFHLLVRIDNLFDETYAASGFTDRTGHFPGAPRSAFAELSYRF